MKNQIILLLFACLILTGFFSSVKSDFQEVKHQIALVLGGDNDAR